jgi:homoserine dehydrogenase
VVSSFYLHLEVADRPGVLAQVAGVLGEHGVSVKSVVQKGVGEGARLAMVTHPIREQDFMAAKDAIAGLDFVVAPPRVIRVIDEHFEG